MSNAYYQALWVEAQNYLNEALILDQNFQNSRGPRDRKIARLRAAELYVRYVAVGNRLESCYEQMLQPQKRVLLRRLLDSTIGRVLELKHELVNLELSEVVYCDDALIKLNLTTEDGELRIPRYYRRERAQEIEERRNFAEKILRNLGEFEERSEGKKFTEAEAIRLLQAHIRARHGRARYDFMKEIEELKERSILRPDCKDHTIETFNAAALKIQTIWRGNSTRRRVQREKLEEMLRIGMVPEALMITEDDKKAAQVEQERYAKQALYKEQYESYLLEAKERIKAEQGALIEENIRIEIRNWLNSCFKQTGKIPELPSAENGGSRMIFSRQDTDSSLSKSTGYSSRDSKRSKKSANKTAKESEQQSDPESELGFKPVSSNLLPELLQANQEYNDIWKDKDESSNFFQEPYYDMIDDQKTREVENELRVGVDHAMRNDIEALQAALDRDRGFKGKRPKKSQKRIRRSGKKSKRRKEKDLTPDRTLDSLFEELLTEGIIKWYPETRINDFKGEKSYANFDLRCQDKDPLPTIGDIKGLITNYCILPLGSSYIREVTPLVRSILIAGPRGSGKKMLVHAICTELGATLFDITPANIANKYPGKSGLVMMLHLITKVSRLVQPSVIFMDGAERPFVKKTPKNDKTDPKRLKKELPKLVKNITNEDRVLLIGITNTPWEGDQKLLFQTYDKVVFIPRPDYSSLSVIWKNLLYKYAGVSRTFETAQMTRLSDGFTIGTVLSAINDVMTTRRIVQLKSLPLQHIEFVNALSTKIPVYKEEEAAFLNWYSKTPTSRKKQRVIDMELQKLEEANDKQKKGQQKKRKQNAQEKANG